MTTTFDLLGENVFTVEPSATGNKGAEINARIADASASVGSTGSKGYVYLPQGRYRVETAIIGRDNVELIGSGPGTRLIATTDISGGADTSTNAMIKFQGTLSPGTMNTTLSAFASKDGTSFTVGTAMTLASGDWAYIEGNNLSSNSSGDSDGVSVTLKEIIQVGTVSGTLLYTMTHLAQYHASGVSAKAVSPASTFAVRDLDLEGSASTVAVGILAQRAVDVEISGVSGKGFSRALINFEGVKGFSIDKIYSRGENNSVLFFDSSMEGRWENVRCNPRGTRFHSSGIPRGLLCFRNRCTDISGGDGFLARGCVGVQIWGGKNLTFGDLTIRDMDTDRADTQWQTVSEGGGAGRIGAGITGGAGPLAYAEFGHGIKFRSITIDDCRHPQQGTAVGCAAYVHDWLDFWCGNFSIRNFGHVSTQMNGVVMSDVGGHIDQLVVAGVFRGLYTENAYAQVQINQYSFAGGPGSGSNQEQPLVLTHADSAGSPRLRRYGYANTSNPVLFGAGFDDYTLTIDTVHADSVGEFSDCVFSLASVSFAAGDVVELDPSSAAGTRSVKVADGPNVRNAVVALDSSQADATIRCVVCPLPARKAVVKCTTAAVEIGDLLVASATDKRAETDNTPSSTLEVLGRALTNKAAGSEGFVVIGPV